MRPYLVKTPWFVQRFFHNYSWRISTKKKEIYLTFDDGPVPGITENILEVLDGYGIKATFFCVGENVRKYPGIMAKLVNGGHRVGNHTFNHLNGWQCDTATYRENIEACQTVLEPFIHDGKSRLFRPPYGRFLYSRHPYGPYSSHC